MKKAARALSTLGYIFDIIAFALVLAFLGLLISMKFFGVTISIENESASEIMAKIMSDMNLYMIYVASIAALLLISIVIIGLARAKMVKTKYMKAGPFVAHLLTFFFTGNLFYLLSGIFGLAHRARAIKYKDQHI